MAKNKEVNVIVDAKNKSKGAFVEIKKDLKQLGDEANKRLSKFSKSFADADKVIMSFSDKMKWMDKLAKRTFQGTAAAAGIYIGATLRDFSQLNDGISRVNTLYDQTRDSQRKMYQDSIKMFSLLPTDFNKITQGIYDTISAGADPKYATMFARKFGMAGVAGDADMDVVTKAAMGTMNAYKLEAKDLNRILDLQFMTVKDGITSYSELASSLGTGVLANAYTAGATLEELYGSIAMITKNAIPANIATTSLNQMFNKFTDTKVIKEFKKFGVQIQDSKKNTRPLIEILKDLNYQFDKRKMTSEQRKGFFKELLGSDEAARAILPLISDLKEFQKILGDMDNSSGAMKDAFNDRLESMSTQFKLFWNQIKSFGLEQVLTLEPLLNAVMEPWIKRNKLELEIADMKDALEFEKDPHVKKLIKLEIEGLEKELSAIDLTPVEKFRDSLAESVKELEKINPPLAKFLDTIGNFVLNFVGEEGAENREKAGNVVKGAVGVYAFKKAVDVMAWMSKNFKWIGDLFKKDESKSPEETLIKTLQTMNVNANVVNVYGNSVNNMGSGLPGGGIPTAPSPPGGSGGGNVLKNVLKNYLTYKGLDTAVRKGLEVGKNYLPQLEGGKRLLELAEPALNTVEITWARNLPTKIYVPEEYKIGGEKYNEVYNQMLDIGKNKKGESKQVDPSIINTSLTDELLKMWQLQNKIDNNINMQSLITVEPPLVETKIYIDGKNIPAQKVEVDYRKVEKQSEVQARRYGRPEMSPY